MSSRSITVCGQTRSSSHFHVKIFAFRAPAENIPILANGSIPLLRLIACMEQNLWQDAVWATLNSESLGFSIEISKKRGGVDRRGTVGKKLKGAAKRSTTTSSWGDISMHPSAYRSYSDLCLQRTCENETFLNM